MASEFGTGDAHGWGRSAAGVAGVNSPGGAMLVVVTGDRCCGGNAGPVGCMLWGGVEADLLLPEVRVVGPFPGEAPSCFGCVAAGFGSTLLQATPVGLVVVEGAGVPGWFVVSGAWAVAASGPPAAWAVKFRAWP